MGDYELLFGAGKLHLEIVGAPAHRQQFVYGFTKTTQVFRSGFANVRNQLDRLATAGEVNLLC